MQGPRPLAISVAGFFASGVVLGLFVCLTLEVPGITNSVREENASPQHQVRLSEAGCPPPSWEHRVADELLSSAYWNPDGVSLSDNDKTHLQRTLADLQEDLESLRLEERKVVLELADMKFNCGDYSLVESGLPIESQSENAFLVIRSSHDPRYNKWTAVNPDTDNRLRVLREEVLDLVSLGDKEIRKTITELGTTVLEGDLAHARQ
ncbi:MAG: hypothetical protein AB1486_11260 [Planctomycetota bacterium]